MVLRIKQVFFISILILIGIKGSCQSINSPTLYHKVALKNMNQKILISLFNKGVPLDHHFINEKGEIEIVVNDYELDILKNENINYELKIRDLASFNEEKLLMDDSWKRTLTGGACDLENYNSGSMGGFHGADEVFENLDAMRSKFPNLISKKESIGKTVEGRDIYMVKISDNPDEDEDEAVAYFDGLTHAREPMSMEVLLYYMWWLLEKYETDPSVKYLVDNREIYFVPVVNVDGYKYNQSTNADGGGMHRKNRRNNNCSNQGIDLNRNFDAEWGNASTDPCSDTYRGPEAFSEPESKAVGDLLMKIKPLTGFSNHSHGHMMLSPKGVGIVIPQHDLFSVFAMEMMPKDFIGHGTPKSIIGYEAGGSTLDYLYLKAGTIGWTPEIGNTNTFWPVQSDICPLNKEMIESLFLVSWMAGDFAGFNSFSFQNDDGLIPNGTAQLIIRVKNKGLSTTSKNVKVEISSDNPVVEIKKGSVDYGDIRKREFADNEKEPFEVYINKDAKPGDDVKLLVKVYQNGSVSYKKELLLTVGKPNILFYDGAENGKNNWEGDWEVTENQDYGGVKCFTDSKTKNYIANVSSSFELNEGVDLSGTTRPFLEFAAKWSLGIKNDYVKIEVNNGGSWTALKGLHTGSIEDGQGYSSNSHWVQEKIDISSYKGSSVKFRFSFNSDIWVHSDGFYFDEFRVVDYLEDVASNINSEKVDINFSVFPIPSSGFFQIMLNAGKDLNDVKVIINNIYGQAVYEERIGVISNENVHLMDVSHLAKGVYFLNLTNGKRSATKKIIIE